MRVLMQDEVFWVVTPCSVVVGYQRFGGPCCSHLHFTLKTEAAWTSVKASNTSVTNNTSLEETNIIYVLLVLVFHLYALYEQYVGKTN